MTPYTTGVSTKHANRLRSAVPDLMLRSLDLYITTGAVPGSCTRAILTGDLFGAFGEADRETQAAMPAIVAYIHQCLPVGAYGSQEAVGSWIAHQRAMRTVGRA